MYAASLLKKNFMFLDLLFSFLNSFIYLINLIGIFLNVQFPIQFFTLILLSFTTLFIIGWPRRAAIPSVLPAIVLLIQIIPPFHNSSTPSNYDVSPVKSGKDRFLDVTHGRFYFAAALFYSFSHNNSSNNERRGRRSFLLSTWPSFPWIRHPTQGTYVGHTICTEREIELTTREINTCGALYISIFSLVASCHKQNVAAGQVVVNVGACCL